MHVVMQFLFEAGAESATIRELVSTCFTDTLDTAKALGSSEAYSSVAENPDRWPPLIHVCRPTPTSLALISYSGGGVTECYIERSERSVEAVYSIASGVYLRMVREAKHRKQKMSLVSVRVEDARSGPTGIRGEQVSWWRHFWSKLWSLGLLSKGAVVVAAGTMALTLGAVEALVVTAVALAATIVGVGIEATFLRIKGGLEWRME